MMEPNNSVEIPNKRYFTIGEVSNITTKRTGNRRYYSQNDILTILKIHELISIQGFTIDGAKQKISSSSENLSQDNQTLSLIKKDIQKIIDVLDK